jgi:hypothetical protein
MLLKRTIIVVLLKFDWCEIKKNATVIKMHT